MTISSLAGKDELEVEENSAVGTVLALVHVTDPDSGSNGDVRCVLKSTLFNLINHYRNEYTLVTASVFDREHRDRYDVDLTCWDDGSPSLVATTSISIQILDVNDNFPLVDPVFDVAVQENNDPDEVLLRITATDRDSTNNSRLHFPSVITKIVLSTPLSLSRSTRRRVKSEPGYRSTTRRSSNTGSRSWSEMVDRSRNPPRVC